jgi:CRISPR-associated protein Csa1
MYFFSNEDNEKLTRFLLPKSREMQISEDLRGWNWSQPPLEPIYDLQLSVSDIASQYCPNGRDLFLKKVQGLKVPPNKSMLAGSFFHGILCDFIVKAKKLVYLYGKDLKSVLQNLEASTQEIYEDQLRKIGPLESLSDLIEKAKILLAFEIRSFAFRFQEVLTRQPHLGTDALVFRVLPVVVEQRIDGSRLGLSRYLSCDAFYAFEPIIIDLKFGSKKEFHALGSTGYALVFESLFGFPVNICCIVYVSFSNNELKIEKDFHLISDELRMAFIEERDHRMRMVYEEIDPGLPDNCYEFCQFQTVCKGK